jgi:hypothetical protein
MLPCIECESTGSCWWDEARWQPFECRHPRVDQPLKCLANKQVRKSLISDFTEASWSCGVCWLKGVVRRRLDGAGHDALGAGATQRHPRRQGQKPRTVALQGGPPHAARLRLLSAVLAGAAAQTRLRQDALPVVAQVWNSAVFTTKTKHVCLRKGSFFLMQSHAHFCTHIQICSLDNSMQNKQTSMSSNFVLLRE